VDPDELRRLVEQCMAYLPTEERPDVPEDLEVTDKLGVKETVIRDGNRPVRYLLCRGTDRATEAAQVREEILARLTEELEGSRTTETHTRKACDLLSKSGYARYLREMERGALRIDRGAVRRHERLDGKYVLMTNDLETPAGELVTGYRDMWRVERAFRSMKTALAIELVYHRTRKRIIWTCPSSVDT